MNIRFKHITAKNFMSFRNLDFDIGAFDGKTVLITGYNDDIQGESSKQNGAGKSTLSNAILFAIYGEVLNPLKKSTSIRNWSPEVTAKDDVEVVLTLESSDTEYAIQRLLKGKKCSGELHVFSRNLSEEKEEWTEITLSTMAETQRMIESDIIPCGKESFLRCVILTADQNKNFFRLNKSEKNSFFESLFGLTKYSDAYNKLHRKTLDETASLTASSKSIDKININIAKLERDREAALKNKEDIKNAESELEKCNTELETFKKDNKILEKTKETEESYEKFKDSEKTSMKSKMEKFDSENGIHGVGKDHKIVFNSEDDASVISKKVEEYDRNNSIRLDDSGNIVFDNEEYEALSEKSKSVSVRIENGKKEVKKLNTRTNELNSEMSSIKSEIETIRSRIGNMKSSLKAHSKITDILCEDCISKYMDSVDISDYGELIKKLESEIEPKNLEIEKRNEEKSKTETTLEKYERAISELEKELSETNEKLESIRSERKSVQLERTSFIRSVNADIKRIHDEIQLKRDSMRSSMIMEYREACSEYDRKIEKLKKEYGDIESELSRNVKNAEYKLKLLSEIGSDGFDSSIKSLTESLDAEKIEFDKLTETISHYKALEDVIKPENIRKSVIPDMIKELNFRICGYLAKMGSNYSCSFDEDFESTFISNSGTEAEYNNFSSGEKMRLSIACCLAFRDFMQVRLNFHPNMLIIDEFIDSNLDAMAVSGIMDMIHFMVGTEKISAFIISHRSEIKQDTFDSEILIRKKNDDSKLIIDGIES